MDPSSYADATQLRTTHLDLHLTADFTKKILHGHVNYIFHCEQDISSVALDVRNLIIHSCKLNDIVLKSEIVKPKTQQEYASFGGKLLITLPALQKKGSTFQLRIAYETTPESEALQWLDPEQTCGKKHPYLFSQCQSIHARSMLPCQDTPSVKATYNATIKCKKPLVCVMSATTVGVESDKEWNLFKFEQKIAIPVRWFSGVNSC